MEEETIYNEFDRTLYRTGSPVYKSLGGDYLTQTSDVSPDNISSGVSTAIVEQGSSAATAAGKTLYNNTQTGYILGIDKGIAKFYIGNTTNYLNWTGTQLIISGNITASSIDIPDTTSANSFHVDSSGNAWWGATTLGASTASVLNTGAATFSSINITGGTISGISALSVSVGGTGSTSFTAGSIVFSNGTILTQDNSNFFWDDTNNRLGIGTTLPKSDLHISDGNTPDASLITSDRFLISSNTQAGSSTLISSNTAGDRAVYKGVRSRGTVAVPLVPLVNDDVLTFLGAIYDGVETQGTAGVFFKVDGTVSAGVAPQRISFVTSETTAIARTEKMTIKADGKVGIGTTAPLSILHTSATSETDLATRIVCDAYSTGQLPGWVGRRARGTAGSPTAAQSGDYLMSIAGRGYGATAFPSVSTGSFNLQATENFTDSAMGTKATIRTTDNGSTTQSDKVTVLGNGNVGIGTITPTAVLHLKAGTATANTAPLKFTSGTNLTTAEAGVMEYNGNHYLSNATLRFSVGGNLFNHFADVSVGGAETDIFTNTLAVNTFNGNGDKVIASYGGNFVTVGTEIVQLKVYFAGTAIWDSTGIAVTTGTTSWNVDVKIIRVSSTVIRYNVTLNTTGASGFVYCSVGELTGLTLSNTNILKITGTSSGVGSGVGDIVGKMGYVKFEAV